MSTLTKPQGGLGQHDYTRLVIDSDEQVLNA